ncbi:hypothetical protein ACS0TY_025587 [Phlomoides rotata]
MISPFLLLLLQFIFFLNIKAQHPSENTLPSSDDSVSNFQPSLPVVISMLAIMFSLTFFLLLYAKFCHRNNSSVMSHDGLATSRGALSGVDKTVVESLPFFRFSSLKGSKDGLECAVCLAKFEDVEILRLLPKCKHAFHIDCIDLWLERHATCPLCRQRVSADDLSESSSSSLRFLWREESSMEVYVEREESRQGSSRFSICSSFRKIENEEEMPIPECMDLSEDRLHRFNHKIIVSDVAMKSRWSNVTSSDLMFLNSEILNQESTSYPKNEDEMMRNIKEEMERKRMLESKVKEIINPIKFPVQESKGQLDPNEKRSMSEIVIHPRLMSEDCSSSVNVEEERMRRLWLPIARKTLEWFVNRDRRPAQSQRLNHLQTSN